MPKWFLFILYITFLSILIVVHLRNRRKKAASERCSSDDKHYSIDPTVLEKIDATPDLPISFGYKNTWLAIQTSDAEQVLKILQLDEVKPANWSTGIPVAYHVGYTFVSPSIDGWVFVVGDIIPGLGADSAGQNWQAFMRLFAERFAKVQYFSTHRVSDYHAWALFVNGKEQRAFASCGDILVSRGEPTPGECELSTSPFDELDDVQTLLTGKDFTNPSEEEVMLIAEKWSINPQNLPDTPEGSEYPAGTGWIGRIRSDKQSA